MAVSISFGLGFATLLVLFVVPVLLSYIEQLSNYIGQKRFDKTSPGEVKI
jgi:predicted RND superfamily exporter protein